jgi:hypothetical protein
MMTGRRSKLAPQVQHIMQNLDIACDEYIFNHTAGAYTRPLYDSM